MGATFNIRDIPDDIATSIQAAAAAAGARSREAYLRDLLGRVFGPNESLVAAVSARARAAVLHFEDLGRFRVLQPAPTISRIARALGHEDPSVLEAELRGDRPLSFSDGDRLCDLLSLDAEWLESGGHDQPRFRTRAQYHDCRLLLRAFLEAGVNYDELYFTLSDGEGSEGSIIGHTASEDPAIGWRYDLLVAGIPIHNSVGATGARQRRDFADLMIALYDERLFPDSPTCIGRLVPHSQYLAMLSGYVHPATLTNTYALGNAQPMARQSDWHEDFCEFDSVERHTRSYSAGHSALLEDLKVDGITSTDRYQEAVRKRLASWKVQGAL
ncbi:MAG TPA: hypothetical protein VFO29_01590 [Candidatus Rubrimentiphilum sp.]|nr:hypothetical protein [Candidatus Rubrimentiphilum sp.]